MNHDFERRLGNLDFAFQNLSEDVERLRKHVELLHVECAESTKRCSELQDEMKSIRKLLESLTPVDGNLAASQRGRTRQQNPTE